MRIPKLNSGQEAEEYFIEEVPEYFYHFNEIVKLIGVDDNCDYRRALNWFAEVWSSVVDSMEFYQTRQKEYTMRLKGERVVRFLIYHLVKEISETIKEE